MGNSYDILNDFISFLNDCPSYFHVISEMEDRLLAAGFTKVREKDNFKDLKDGKYFVSRHATAIAAFRKNSKNPKGYRIIGSHTDSPSLRIKPFPDLHWKDSLSLGVEVYGGPILSTWFDRDLSIAGRVIYLTATEQLKTALVDFKNPIALIPSLAAHLRKKDHSDTFNRQKELPPLILQQLPGTEKRCFESLLSAQLSSEGTNDVKEILDHDLFLYDTQPATATGLDKAFISAGKLDNLLSTYLSLKAITNAEEGQNCMMVSNCHEEVGSSTDTGAGGNFLEHIIERTCHDREDYFQTLAASFLISADNAHAIHPNYSEKHDPNHQPELNKGPVIKVNANQRYTTTGQSSSFFKQLCKSCDVPYQTFVSRSDMACGSTIGPITATRLGIQALDIGAPTYAMHSIREVAGTKDFEHMYKVFKAFYQS